MFWDRYTPIRCGPTWGGAASNNISSADTHHHASFICLRCMRTNMYANRHSRHTHNMHAEADSDCNITNTAGQQPGKCAYWCGTPPDVKTQNRSSYILNTCMHANRCCAACTHNSYQARRLIHEHNIYHKALIELAMPRRREHPCAFCMMECV